MTRNDEELALRARRIAASYPIVIEPAGENKFIGYTTKMPGVVSEGATREQCAENVVADQTAAVMLLLRHNLELPRSGDREKQLNLRLTVDEYDAIRSATEDSEARSMSEFVREAALQAAKVVRAQTSHLKSRGLNKIRKRPSTKNVRKKTTRKARPR